MAYAPPVPINKGVRLGIWPKLSTSVEDLNLFPSAETKLMLIILLSKFSLPAKGKLSMMTA